MKRSRALNRLLANGLVGLIIAATIAAPFSAASAACGTRHGDWRTVAGPTFKSGPNTITDLAIDPRAPNRMFVINGESVMRSSDGGCSWREVLVVDEEDAFQRPVAGGAAIESVQVPERAAARAYLLVEESVGPVARPHVLTTNNGGDSWRLADTGLPPAGATDQLALAPSEPAAAYVVIDVAGAADLLFATEDGAATWQARGRLPAAANDLQVDPSNPNDLWLGAGDGLYHSTDGGGNWAAIDDFTAQSTGPVDVFHAGAGPARVMAFETGTSTGRVSQNGGETWIDVGVPGPPNSIAHGSFADSILIATPASVYAWAPTVLNWVDLEPPNRGIRGLVADRATRSDFYGHTARTVEIYGGPVGGGIDIPDDILEIPDISLLDTVPRKLGRPTLDPDAKVVRIPAGDRKAVTYDLGLPRTLTPLDVFFVVDTSSSMTQVIAEAAEALEKIHNGLATSGASVKFGLAEFRSYPTDVPPKEPPGEVTDNYVYRQVLDVGASAAQLAEAIRGLEAQGGGIYDAQLEALWQAATGSGADVWPPGPSSRDVPPGLQADFRINALRIVLHVGDEPFGREDSARDNDNNVTRPESQVARPDIPEFQAVADALREKDVKQLGLSLYPDATPDLRKMASATDAFAPAGGVDCDANGSIDVEPGAPLVCVLQQDEITDANMAPAIVNLVEAVRTQSVVKLETSTDRDGVIESVSPDSYANVLLQADNSLEFDVTYRCPRSLAGKRSEIELTARGLIGAAPSATTTVVCGDVEDEEEVLPFQFLQPFLVAVPIIPFGPPPPIPQLGSATQAQAQAQANAAMAAQEQEQPQVAFVHALHQAIVEEEEYAFTSLRKEPAIPPLVPFGAAAMLMSLAFGVSMSMRTRLHLNPARARRR